MDDITQLLNAYPPRLVLRHEIKKESKVLEPFDFYIVEDWKDMEEMCSDARRKKELRDEATDIEQAVNNLNPTPMCCSHSAGPYNEAGITYEGSTFVMIPYTLEADHRKIMNVCAHVFKQFMDTHHNVFKG